MQIIKDREIVDDNCLHLDDEAELGQHPHVLQWSRKALLAGVVL